MAQAYDSCDMACSKLLMESLRTHTELDGIDLSGIVQDICGNISREKYVTFIVLTNRIVGLGRWAWLHNKVVDTCIIRGDVGRLLREIDLGKRMFREVFDSDLLTKEEIAVIDAAIDLESSVIRGMIENYRHGDNPLVSYDRCKEMVCVVSGSMPVELSMSPYVYVADWAGSMPEVYRVNKHNLIISLAMGKPINPHTGRSFTPETAAMLSSKYRKEIKICHYAMRYIDRV